MTKSRCGSDFVLLVLLFLSCLSAVLTDHSVVSESLRSPLDAATAFDSRESPTMDPGSDEDSGIDLTSPEVMPGRQGRRNSFRADLGKRYPVDLTRIEGKRAWMTSPFRPGIGQPGWYFGPTNLNYKRSGEQVVEVGMEPKSGSRREKRFVVGELGRQVEREGPRSWNDVEKRARSSFRADLGKRLENEHGYGMVEYGTDNKDVEAHLKEGTAYPKRTRYAFRGDLGKRSPLVEDEKRRYAFRGDLGRKRSLTLGHWDTRVPMPSSSFDVAEPLRKLIDSTKGSSSDRAYDGGLEKRRFRADLG